MKRQFNPKAPEDQQREKEDSASGSSQSPSNSPNSPESSSQPSNYAILYVDVVKNMTKLAMSQPPPPPPCPPPEFSLFREDFPALPGTRISSVSSSMVPDDWTAMLSDDEGDEGSPECMDELTVSGSSEEDEEEEFQEEEQLPPIIATAPATMGMPIPVAGPFNCSFLPQLFGYLNNPVGFNVSLIFGKQFLHEGVRQRAQLRSLGHQIPSASRSQAPPGFENTQLYARLNMHESGKPCGGVYFEGDSTDTEETCKTDANLVDGCFGMLGLARNLGLMQHNPHLKEQFFGEECDHETEFNCKYQPKHNPIPEWTPPKVPKNYVIAGKIDLQQPKMEQMEVELLFYFFYTFTGDMMQLLAAAELAERSWRYHKVEHLWILRQMDNPNYIYRGFQESGEYNYFNMFKWRILPRYFQLEPEHLERTLSKDELYEEYGYHPQMAR
ncbi:regulator of gene activity [Drosophila kikkawai]|uniref:Regulator of gene activity n=1 Tax=Drosophila kikkawai TaxID=30033 RepID=A0A6P4HYX0_DROKI|nr:regulator of gene activity [Drosophila kikkawai]